MSFKIGQAILLMMSLMLSSCGYELKEEVSTDKLYSSTEATEATESLSVTTESETEETTLKKTEQEQTEEQQEEKSEKVEESTNEIQSTESITADGPLMKDDSDDEQNNEVINTSNLANEKYGWYFNPNDEHKPPTASDKVELAKYDAYYLGDTSQKEIYLTFDEGYENGYSSKILDVLKQKDVKAAFFVTKSYIKQNQDLIKRMVDEGHVVGNHSVQHKSSPDLTDEELTNELTETAEYFKEVTGQDMPKVFRPPMGEYSERTLAVTKNAGYKSIFWSFAYKDWLTDQQPGKQVAYDTIMKRYHNGAIMLLHAVSQSNTEALGDVIDSLREEGYTFKKLTDLD